MKAFREGADIHVRTASQVFGTPEAEVTAEQRARTKAINFGIIYGQSGFGLARVARHLAERRARADRRLLRALSGRARVHRLGDRERASENGFARTLSGRRRYLPDLRLAEPADPAGGRAHGGELGHPGHRGRRDQARHGRAGRRPARRGRPERPDDPAGPRRAGLRGRARASARRWPAACSRACRTRSELSVPLVVHVGFGPNWLAAH